MGVTRRDMIKRTSMAGVGLAAGLSIPALIPSRALGAQGRPGANDRIAVGCIGVRNMGGDHVKALLNMDDPQVVALCDVDTAISGEANTWVEDAYGHKVPEYVDFREMLDGEDLDAVFIATPDHWHCLLAIGAMEAGKDVYCEKPLTLRVLEGRAIADTAARRGRIFQTGSQQRSDNRFRKACEMVRNGIIGDLTSIEVGVPGGRAEGMAEDCDPPETLDWDFWLGPSPWEPYNPLKGHYDFRWFYNHSGGQLTNWGAHHIDIAHWGMGMDESGPIHVEGSATFPTTGILETATSYDIHYTYKTQWGEVPMHVSSANRHGVTFIGTEGRVFVDRGTIEPEPASLGDWEPGDDDIKLYVSQSHRQNFFDGVRTRTPCICEAEIGHRSVTACHLGNIAIRTGKPVDWDPVAERATNDPSHNGWLIYSYRDPWEEPITVH
jgi:predicted dehydrogenase